MTNLYEAPKAALIAKHDKTQQVSWIKTIVFSLISLPIFYLLTFPLASFLVSFIKQYLELSSLNHLLIVDALVSFSVLTIFFTLIYCFKNIHTSIVIFFGAFSMFIYWGFESYAFFDGLNPMYPAWYEINLGFNDLLAATIVVFIAYFRNREAS